MSSGKLAAAFKPIRFERKLFDVEYRREATDNQVRFNKIARLEQANLESEKGSGWSVADFARYPWSIFHREAEGMVFQIL